MQHIEKLGAKGDLVNVKRGYARNYLIPRKYAIYATPKNMKRLDEIRSKASEEEALRLEELKNLASKINGISLSFIRKTDEQDNLYGSVSETDIMNELNSQGIQVHKSTIQLEKHIKELGSFSVVLKLHKEVEALLKVEVIKEASTQAVEASEEPEVSQAQAEAVEAIEEPTEALVEASEEPEVSQAAAEAVEASEAAEAEIEEPAAPQE